MPLASRARVYADVNSHRPRYVECSHRVNLFSLLIKFLGFNYLKWVMCKVVFWIRDILVRIRIRGSVLLTYRSGFGSDSGCRSCFLLKE
jgi:hypothetical protein